MILRSHDINRHKELVYFLPAVLKNPIWNKYKVCLTPVLLAEELELYNLIILQLIVILFNSVPLFSLFEMVKDIMQSVH